MEFILQIHLQKYKILRAIFTFVCIALTLYMCTKQVYLYFENNDTLSFDYKEFNQSPSDLYPTFSYCFEDNFGGVYDKTYFSEVNGMTRQQYQKVLLGRDEFMLINLIPNDTNIFEIDVDNVTLKPQNLFMYMDISTVNHSVAKMKRYSAKTGESFSPLYKSYQDPIKICFTRKSNFEKDIIRQVDELQTIRTKLLWKRVTERTKVMIYVHADGQLTRAFRKPAYWYRLQKGLWPKPVDKYLRLQIVKVSVIRKRPNSKIPCNPKLIDDDNEFRNKIMDIVGCVPPYWKQFHADSAPHNDCRTLDKLKEVFDRITNYKTIFKHYHPPCNDMSLVTTSRVESMSANGMELWYLPDRYEESINRRDFEFEMFWSSVGGFLGMFLGWSLLQLPDMIPKIKDVNECVFIYVV